MLGNLEPEERVMAEEKAQLENHLAAKRKAIAVCNQGVVQKLYDAISELGWDCYDDVTVEMVALRFLVFINLKITTKNGQHLMVLASTIKMRSSLSRIGLVILPFPLNLFLRVNSNPLILMRIKNERILFCI